MFTFQGKDGTIQVTLIMFQMYSSSLRFQQNKPKNHSNGKAQKCQSRPNVTTSKIFIAPYICNNSRMTSLYYFQFFYNLRKLLSLLSFIIFLLLKFVLQI